MSEDSFQEKRPQGGGLADSQNMGILLHGRSDLEAVGQASRSTEGDEDYERYDRNQPEEVTLPASQAGAIFGLLPQDTLIAPLNRNLRRAGHALPFEAAGLRVSVDVLGQEEATGMEGIERG